MTRFLLLLATALAFASPLMASSVMPALQVEGAWIRLLPGDLPAGGYMTLDNLSDAPRRLVSVTSVDFEQVMMHKSDASTGLSTMRAVDGVTVPAHGKVEFAPGGYHLMLMQRRHDIAVGQVLVLTLHFADGHSMSAGFEVRSATGASGHAEHDHAM